MGSAPDRATTSAPFGAVGTACPLGVVLRRVKRIDPTVTTVPLPRRSAVVRTGTSTPPIAARARPGFKEIPAGTGEDAGDVLAVGVGELVGVTGSAEGVAGPEFGVVGGHDDAVAVGTYQRSWGSSDR